MFEIKGKYTNAMVMIDTIDDSCYKQIITFLNHPVFTNPIKIMPDTHAGAGAVIGFTMELADKVIPNVIGVDIGCGMHSVQLAENLLQYINLKKLDRRIREEIPMGFGVHYKPVFDMRNDFPWGAVKSHASQFAIKYNEKFGINIKALIPDYSYKWFESHMKEIGMDIARAEKSIGTLGGGNHFIEIGEDEDKKTWITVHTGSRNLGLKIAKFWQNKTNEKLSKEMKEEYARAVNEIKDKAVTKKQRKEIGRKIKEARVKYLKVQKLPKSLDYLEYENAYAYLFDMIFAQQYAAANREQMMKIIISVINPKIKTVQSIDTVHNFISHNDMIIRKGSVQSYEGQKLIIPFNMRDGILICEGKGNADWNYSAPHGAGRIMGRAEAKRKLSLQEFKDTMGDVYSTSVCEETLDEAPGAYKDAKLIENAIGPTVKILNRIKPILNIKAKE